MIALDSANLWRLARRWLLAFGLLACLTPAMGRAEEVPVEPFLRIETGFHTAKITDLALSPDRTILATVAEDRTLRLWELATGRALDVFRVPIGRERQGTLFAVEFAPSGRSILVGGITGFGAERDIYLFDPRSGEIGGRRLRVPGAVFDLDFAVDGKGAASRLAVAHGGAAPGITFYSPQGKELARDLDYPSREAPPTFVEFAADGRAVAVSHDNSVRVYKPSGELDARSPVGHLPNQARFSPDGRYIAIAYQGEAHIDILEARTMERRRRLVWARSSQVPTLHALAWVQRTGGRLELWAGGGLRSAEGRTVVRRFADPLRGEAFNDTLVGIDAVSALEPVGDGRVVVTTTDPSWVLLGERGEIQQQQGSTIAEFGSVFERTFALSKDGLTLDFTLERHTDSPVLRFSIEDQRLLEARQPAATGRYEVPTGLIDWRNSTRVTYRDGKLALQPAELARSVDGIDGGGFVLGADRSLYWYDAGGRLVAQRGLPAAAFGVLSAAAAPLMVAALGDGTVRWYRLAADRPLAEVAALFVHRDRRRWVLWTPDGFFAHGEAGGQELVGYHYNEGAAQSARWIEFKQLYRVFYRPPVLRERFGLQPTYERPAAPLQQAMTAVLEQPAPAVEILSFCPADAAGNAGPCVDATALRRGIGRALPGAGNGRNQRTLGPGVDHVLVRFRARTSVGEIGAVDLFVNGRTTGQGTRGIGRVAPAATTASPPPEGDWRPGERLIALRDGDNSLEVRAYDERGVFGRSEPLILTTSLRPSRPERRLFVLAVGVNDYTGDVQPLRLARKDAVAVARALEVGRPAQYSDMILDRLEDSAASGPAVRDAFERLARNARADDAVVVYLAGHGILEGETYYYLPSDVRSPTELADRGLSQHELVGLLGRIAAANTLIFLDTCHSGAFPAQTPGTIGNETGLYVLAASSSVQEALDGYDEFTGVFAKAVLEGLAGEAADRRGLVDAVPLSIFVRDRVATLALERSFHQQAQFSAAGGNIGAFPLAATASAGGQNITTGASTP